MTTFSKVLNILLHQDVPTSQIQNRKLLPVVKQCANDSMVNNAMYVREIIKNDAGESGISIITYGKSTVICLTMMLLRQFPSTQRSALVLKTCPTSPAMSQVEQKAE